MSRAYTCDRCGVHYEGDDPPQHRGDWYNCTFDGPWHRGATHRQYDLCPTCGPQLEQLIEGYIAGYPGLTA